MRAGDQLGNRAQRAEDLAVILEPVLVDDDVVRLAAIRACQDRTRRRDAVVGGLGCGLRVLNAVAAGNDRRRAGRCGAQVGVAGQKLRPATGVAPARYRRPAGRAGDDEEAEGDLSERAPTSALWSTLGKAQQNLGKRSCARNSFEAAGLPATDKTAVSLGRLHGRIQIRTNSGQPLILRTPLVARWSFRAASRAQVTG